MTATNFRRRQLQLMLREILKKSLALRKTSKSPRTGVNSATVIRLVADTFRKVQLSLRFSYVVTFSLFVRIVTKNISQGPFRRKTLRHIPVQGGFKRG